LGCGGRGGNFSGGYDLSFVVGGADLACRGVEIRVAASEKLFTAENSEVAEKSTSCISPYTLAPSGQPHRLPCRVLIEAGNFLIPRVMLVAWRFCDEEHSSCI
jgi:hypothetical protein